MTASSDPWRNLATPADASGFSARRIAGVGSEQWGVYWAVDRRRQYLLIMTHGAGLRSQHRSPTLRGLRIESRPDEEGHREFLVFRLTEVEHRDIFYRFCSDIVDAVEIAESVQEALDICIMRTWRWHRLLKGGRDGRLTAEEQKGLIGELILLQRHVMSAIGVGNGVRSWVGPLGARRDFEMGSIGVESKACAPLATTLRVASAEQLDSTRTTPLFLHVIEIAEVPGEIAGAVTITDVVERVQELIEARDVAAAAGFEERLWAVGYDSADDYSDRRWVVGSTSFFRVGEGFPRVTPRMLPAGVTDVRYRVSLAQCEEFRVETATVVNSISGDGNEDKMSSLTSSDRTCSRKLMRTASSGRMCFLTRHALISWKPATLTPLIGRRTGTLREASVLMDQAVTPLMPTGR